MDIVLILMIVGCGYEKFYLDDEYYESAKITGNIQAGRVLVDGLGVGDVGNIVLRDRKHLAQDGLIIIVTTIDREKGEMVSKPDVISRGFVYVRESEQVLYDKGKTDDTSLGNVGIGVDMSTECYYCRSDKGDQ